jgi:uncharacterized membrane protein YfcA
VIGAIAIGVAGGIVAGMLGVGGGVLFVPGLVIFLNLSQHQAEATSLLAIIPVALVGAARQARYGNVRLRDGATLGVLAAAGAVGGVALANVVPARGLELGFAALTTAVAVQMARRALRAPEEEEEDGERSPLGAAEPPGREADPGGG